MGYQPGREVTAKMGLSIVYMRNSKVRTTEKSSCTFLVRLLF